MERLIRQALYEHGRGSSPAEQRSWLNSLPVLADDLVAAGLENVEVLLEYQLPLTSKRADVVLAGQHPRTGRESYVVVELKQWSSAHLWEDDESLVLVEGMRGGPKLHPSRQVQGYCEYLVDFARSLGGDDDLVAGLAYLHNVTNRNLVADLFLTPPGPQSQLYTGADRTQLRTFLRSRLDANVSGADAADSLLHSPSAPSQPLLAVAADEIRNREQFVLQDDQQLAVDLVKHLVEKARTRDHKSVVVVAGGPGSGKSVVALSLLGELAREGRSVLHATGSRSFTQTLRRVAGHRAPRVQKMFRYFNQFMDAERNGLDVLILDEAHRIRETSVNRYTRSALRTERPQLDELIAAARVPVFLLDEHQVVRPGEQGSVGDITSYAARLGLDTFVVHLDEQYRCGGSLTYVRWVEQLLGLGEGGPTPWTGDDRFQVEVAATPEALERAVRSKVEQGYSGRMTAGYCWPWNNPRQDGSLVADVQIGSWSRPWNLKGDRAVGGAPPAALWATDPAGIGQVGCVYTAQGFEYDWNGVILGADLIWRDGHFITVRRANRDPDFRNVKAVDDVRFDALVRNVYKVLLTRGMIGTVLYSPDEETREALFRLTR